MSETPPPAGPNMREHARMTVFWGVGLNFASKAGSILLSLVLARLLAPAVFGQYATINAIILFLMAFSMQRFNESLFFEKSPTEQDYHRHLGFGIVLHLVLFAVANLIAFGMAFTRDFKVLQPYLHIASIPILLNIPRFYYLTHLKYELKWRRIRILGIASLLLFSVASITLALSGAGVMALLAQDLLIPIPYVIGWLFAEKWLKRARFDLHRHGVAIRFGAARTLSNFLSTGYQTIESMFFSSVTSFTAYGVFNRAKGLSVLLSGWISTQTQGVIYPVLAKMEPKTAGARRAAGMMMRIALWSGAPMAMTGAIVPGPMVHLLFGNQWDAVIPLIRPVVAAAVASAVWIAGAMVFLTNEGPRRALYLDAALVAASLACLPVLPAFGLLTFAYVYGAVNVAMSALLLVVMVVRGILGGGEVIRIVMANAFLIAVGVGVVLFPPFQHLQSALPIAAIFVAAVISTLAMAAGARLLDQPGLSGLCDLLPLSRLTRPLLLLPRTGQRVETRPSQS